MISIPARNARQPMWQPYNDSQTLGSEGSESGLIQRDEVYDNAARITLEADGRIAPYSITCGIFGWMVHTHFLSK